MAEVRDYRTGFKEWFGKDITVECKCGWRGLQSALVDDKETGEKHCPLCHAIFTRWPPKQS